MPTISVPAILAIVRFTVRNDPWKPLILSSLAILLMDVATTQATTLTGRVFIDANQNETFDPPHDQAVTGAKVFWETEKFVVSDGGGLYSIEVPDQGGILWVSSPSAASAGPHYHWVAFAGVWDFALPPSPNTDFSFVVASDTHSGLDELNFDELQSALQQAVSATPTPHFLAITGDLTQENRADEFMELIDVMSKLDTAFVPVPGNHDWYDGGASYRSHFGPANYSFESGGARFIVLNDSSPPEERETFLALDGEGRDPEQLTVAFLHSPPGPDVVETLANAGVDSLFTGHLHSNRVHVHPLFEELNTQPLTMGGADLTPAGYRIVTLNQTGTGLKHEHRTTVNAPIATIAYPRAQDPIASCVTPVIASIEYGPNTARASIRALGTTTELRPLGGWTHASQLQSACAAKSHPLQLTVSGHSTNTTRVESSLCVVDPELVPKISESSLGFAWPQLGGGPGHRGFTPEANLDPPLRVAWATALGENVAGGSLVYDRSVVYVPLAAFGDGTAGGVVAVDAMTGAQLWNYRAGFGVRSAVSVHGEKVFVHSLDGTLHALDRSSGQLVWTYQYGLGGEPQVTSLYSSPVVAENDVVYGGVQRELAALAVDTGEVLWSTVPRADRGWFGSASTPAWSQGILVSTFSMGGLGLFANDAQNGALLWQSTPGITAGSHASPVATDDSVFVANWLGQVTALDLRSGEVRWQNDAATGFPWSYGIVGTPVATGTLLLVPTQFGELVAMNAATGSIVWRHKGRTSLFRPAHYRATVASFTATPIVAGSIAWAGGTDGILYALDLDTGRELWSDDFGAPIATGFAVTEGALFAASYDGVVRALVPTTTALEAALEANQCQTNGSGGCGCRQNPRTDDLPGLTLLLVLLLLAMNRRQRLHTLSQVPHEFADNTSTGETNGLGDGAKATHELNCSALE